MKLEFRPGGRPCAPETIAKVEAITGPMSDELRNVLLYQSVGLMKEPAQVAPAGVIGIEKFFSDAPTSDAQIYDINLEYCGQRWPAGMVGFGKDAGGDFWLEATRESDRGAIYYWNRDWEAEEGDPPTEDNLTKVADTFAEFVSRLEPVELDGGRYA